ncbi:phosphoribosylanthranilate isomerase [Chloroflexota bacterium]
MTRIKICGLSEVEGALAAAEAGADFLGLMFADSKRQVTTKRATEIAEAVHRLSNPPKLVGVFANSTVQDVNQTADSYHLDRVQLSGAENWQYCREIKSPIIKAIHVRESDELKDIVNEINTGYQIRTTETLVFLLDTHDKNTYGGTGQVFNWQLAKEVASMFPVMVAGGLTPENVEQLVKEVCPWGVDVSSGVESNGHKDISKIREFISVVRESEKDE